MVGLLYVVPVDGHGHGGSFWKALTAMDCVVHGVVDGHIHGAVVGRILADQDLRHLWGIHVQQDWTWTRILEAEMYCTIDSVVHSDLHLAISYYIWTNRQHRVDGVRHVDLDLTILSNYRCNMNSAIVGILLGHSYVTGLLGNVNDVAMWTVLFNVDNLVLGLGLFNVLEVRLDGLHCRGQRNQIK